jgi:DNA modification methylase
MKSKIEYVSIDTLIPYARNARTHSDAQVAQIAASITEFGWTNPILTDGVKGVIAGHGRLLAARKLGNNEVPIIELSHLTDTQKRAYIIADNKLSLNAGWDDEVLSVEMEELDDEGFDLTLTGFGDEELEGLLEKENTGLTDDDAVPEVPDNPVSKLGDIWELGNHRVMCGDSTSIDTVDLLMNGQKADMVFTDPPYNVSIGTIKHPKFKQREILNDSMSKSEFRNFCTGFASVIKTFTDGIIYCWSGQGADGRIMFTVLDEFFHNSTTIMWQKDQFTLGRGKYQNQYEPCWFGWNKNGNSFVDDRNLVNVWKVNRPKRSDLHPTMKPVELVEIAATHSSKQKDIILDLFGGSGTTLIAAERLNRHACLMELDPKYVDVIINRWQDFTGKEATLDGVTFKEVENERTNS